jgi:hypothetical protein
MTFFSPAFKSTSMMAISTSESSIIFKETGLNLLPLVCRQDSLISSGNSLVAIIGSYIDPK